MAHRLTVEIGMAEPDKSPIVRVTLDGKDLEGVESVELDTQPGGLVRVSLIMRAIAHASFAVVKAVGIDKS